MQYNTSELCDTFAEQVDVLDPIFEHYGGTTSFGGQVQTVKCFEDNALIATILEQDGRGRVLVIDGGGSTRRGLIDAEMAERPIPAADQGHLYIPKLVRPTPPQGDIGAVQEVARRLVEAEHPALMAGGTLTRTEAGRRAWQRPGSGSAARGSSRSCACT